MTLGRRIVEAGHSRDMKAQFTGQPQHGSAPTKLSP